jgi:phenylalanyl-tRNA synthetase beta subunit
MSDNRAIPPLPEGVLTEDQIAKISGGECTAAEIMEIFNNLKETYDNVVDFTSYVMERVMGP